MMKVILGIIFLLVLPKSYAIEFTTESSDKRELDTIKLLQALMQSHDTTKWTFTNKVHIKVKTIPHSHPILTLHTRHTTREQKDLLLSTYLHEQIHWHMDNNQQKTEAAINELRTLFRDVPVGYPEGARDEYSTYLHLLVCYLELDAVSQLLSEARVQAVSHFWKQDHYTWIYHQIDIKHAEIASIIKKHGLMIQ